MKNKQDGVGTQTHYTAHGIEPIDYIVANQMNFLEGNVIKYVTRYKLKNGLEDLQKAQQYLTWLIDKVEKKTKQTNSLAGQTIMCNEGESLRDCVERLGTTEIKNVVSQYVAKINPHIAGSGNNFD